MSEPISYFDYWKEVRELAAEAWEDGRTEEEAQEWVWETVNGHQWVIYTAYHYEVLGRSNNDGYSVENFGAEYVVKDGVLDTCALAFGALYGDVMDALEGARPESVEA